MRLTPSVVCACLLLGSVGTASADADCDPFALRSGSYSIERGDTELGTGEIRLQAGDAPGCYQLVQTAKPHFLLRWLSGPATQSSEFCRLPDGRLRSYRYKQHRSGLGAEKENYSLDFDWDTGTVRGGRFEELPLDARQTDTLLLATRVRQWLCAMPADKRGEAEPLELHYIDHRGADSYTVALMGLQKIQVPAGEFDALLVERIDADDRSSKFWLDPADNMRLLRGEQRKRDDPVVRLSYMGPAKTKN